MKKIVILLFSLLIITSCNDSEISNVDTFSWDDFGKVDTLELNLINNIEQDFCYMLYFKDSLLYFINTSPKNKFITITDLSGNIIGKRIRKGHGANETTHISYIGFIGNDTMFVYNGYQYNIVRYYNLNDFISKENPKPIDVFELGAGRSSIVKIISNNKFIINNNTAKSKIQIIDSNKVVLKHIGGYNDEKMNEKNLLYIKSAFQKYIVVSPLGDKIAFFYSNTDLVEIFDTAGVELYSKKGPDKFDIYNYNSQKINSELERYRSKINKSKLAYGNPSATGKYIYTFYDGEVITGSKLTMQKILVFDWDGNPVKYLYLSEPISAFDIDEKTNTLYGYDTNEGILYKAKLDF